MARFRWHADYFDGPEGVHCVRRDIISADNAGEAEKIALTGMGSCTRVEVRRVATAAPVRVIHASKAEPATAASTLGVFPFASAG